MVPVFPHHVLPHLVVILAGAVLGGVGVFAGVPGVRIADVGHDHHAAVGGLANDLPDHRRIHRIFRSAIELGAMWNLMMRLPRL